MLKEVIRLAQDGNTLCFATVFKEKSQIMIHSQYLRLLNKLAFSSSQKGALISQSNCVDAADVAIKKKQQLQHCLL